MVPYLLFPYLSLFFDLVLNKSGSLLLLFVSFRILFPKFSSKVSSILSPLFINSKSFSPNLFTWGLSLPSVFSFFLLSIGIFPCKKSLTVIMGLIASFFYWKEGEVCKSRFFIASTFFLSYYFFECLNLSILI